MPKAHSQPAGTARRLLSLGLVAWLAGLGCLLGCEGRAAAASAAAPSASESQAAPHHHPAASRHAGAHARHSARRAEAATQSCAAMSAGHGGCCKRAKARAAESAAAESAAVATTDGVADADADSGDPAATSARAHDSGGMEHCPLRRQTSDPARKVGTPDAPAAAKVLAQSHDFEPRSLDRPSAARPRAHDRGGTYLRCCVFLI